jgi:type IV pilus assembly protein PilO
MRGRTDRLWIIGGALAAVVLVALGWFLLIVPTNAQALAFEDQTAVTEQQLDTLERRLRQLQTDQAKLPQFRAELARNQEALPSDSGVPPFLRQLESAGNAVGARVTNVSVGVPAAVPGGGDGVYALPITVTTDGSPGQLSPFLDQLQQVQPRAVLIETANLTAGSGAGMSLTLTMKVFVTLANNAPTPAPTR